MIAPDKAPLDDDWANLQCIERTQRLLLASHTDEQWAKVKTMLKNVGIDDDAVLIGPGISAKQAWTIRGFVDEPVRCSLRDELLYIIERCDIDLRMASPTPQELAEEQDHTTGLCRDLLARLDDPARHNRISPETHTMQFWELPRLEDRLRADLQAYVAYLERCRDELVAEGTSRGKQNRMLHVRFWEALTRIWLDNVSDDVSWTASGHLANFLIACSQPFFPEETTDTAITAFIERRRISRK
jgi:hypothetical protein